MSWEADMDKAMSEHPEWFGMVIDYMGNPVDRREGVWPCVFCGMWNSDGDKICPNCKRPKPEGKK